MTNKGLLRQKYVKFYMDEAKQIIEEFYVVNDIISRRYTNYTKKVFIIFIMSFACLITGCLLPIGIAGIICVACLMIFMPKDLKKEAQNYNKWQNGNLIFTLKI